jgi:hypothetical protein
MEHARAFLTSAGEAVRSIENHMRGCYSESSSSCFESSPRTVSPVPNVTRRQWADSNVAMPRMTAELFREISTLSRGDIETLEIEKKQVSSTTGAGSGAGWICKAPQSDAGSMHMYYWFNCM